MTKESLDENEKKLESKRIKAKKSKKGKEIADRIAKNIVEALNNPDSHNKSR